MGRSNNDVLNVPFAVHDQPDLSACFSAALHQSCIELGGGELAWGYAAPVKPFNGFELRRLEAGGVSVETFGDDVTPSKNARLTVPTPPNCLSEESGRYHSAL